MQAPQDPIYSNTKLKGSSSLITLLARLRLISVSVFVFVLVFPASLTAGKVDLSRQLFNSQRIQSEAPQIDGKLNDLAWMEAEVLGNFVQNTPIPNVPGTQKTEVRMLYDDDAVYIAARMYESNPDSIYNFLTERDNYGNADFFIVAFNTYRDGVNGEGFAVTPAGVQIDVKYSLDEESTTWDAVWESATQIDELGWTAEIRIPYSALRFPEREVQQWGINFGREIRRNRERDWWSAIDPTVDGFLTQTGTVKGIENIQPPTRLFFFPYSSAYYEVNSESGETNSSFNGGMDVKYGLNDAFTVDMTLVPDFGQTRFDDRVLNLTAFEVQFDENRQFFTEGVELFNKAGLFYSRRVGGQPYQISRAGQDLDSGEFILENPAQARLINATKVSGRTDKGLGIGLFNAVEAQGYAIIESEESGEQRQLQTNPLTNYNLLVLDQVLRNNSFLTFTNANTVRDGAARDANVSQLDWKLANKQNRWAISGYGGLSNVWQEDGELQRGESWKAAVGKISGRFTFELAHEQISENFDPNDLGIQFFNNVENTTLSTRLVKYEKFSIFNLYRHTFDINYQRLHAPDHFVNLGFSWQGVYRLQNFHTFGLNAAVEPIETNDFFEARSFQQYYRFPVNATVGGFISSDYSRPFALDLRFSQRWFEEADRSNFFYSISPRIRPNDQLFFVLSFSRDLRLNEKGYVNNINDSIYLGNRKVEVYETSVEGNYILNNRMAINLTLRHYWSEVKYSQFYRLDPENGELLNTDYAGFNDDASSIHDLSFNAFNIDLAYNWRFAPGSEISLVWKNVILQEGTPMDFSYYRNLEETLRAPQINNFSIKVLYFIDYLSLKRG